MRENGLLMAVLLVLILVTALVIGTTSCGDDDDDDDDSGSAGDDDQTTDDDDDDAVADDDDSADCTLNALCTATINCGVGWDSVEQCVESVESSIEDYADYDGYLACACDCLATQDTCDDQTSCATVCWNNFGA